MNRLLLLGIELLLAVLLCLAYCGLAGLLHTGRSMAELSARHPPVDWLALVLMALPGIALIGIFRLSQRGLAVWSAERKQKRPI